MEECELAGVLTRQPLKMLEAFELPMERTIILESLSPDDLSGAQHSRGGAAGKPDLAITAPTDAPKQFVIGNTWLGRRSARRKPRRWSPSPRRVVSPSSGEACAWLIHKEVRNYSISRILSEQEPINSWR
jgi:hypothetical protein